MKEFLIYKKHAVSFLAAVKNPITAIPAIGVLSLSNCQMAILLLFGLMGMDFLTGILASWINWKDSNKEGSFWKHELGFSSTKMRLSLIKSITYFAFILSAFGLEYIFKLKSFKAESYTEHQITLTLVAIAISCAIEFYSIFFENIPKAGFSIEKKIRAIFSKVKAVVNAIRNLKNGNNGSA